MPDLDEYTPPDAWLKCAEKRELLRRAALSALERSHGGRDLTPKARQWAECWASQPPLTTPLSSGQPKELAHEPA